MIAPLLDYRPPELPTPPPRLRFGAVALAIALPCFILLGIGSRLPLGHIDSLVYDDILNAIGLTLLAAGAMGVAGLFHRPSRVLAIAAVGLSLGGLMLIPMMIVA